MLLVLIAAIPLGLYLAQNTQIFRPRAGSDPINFKGPNVVQRGGKDVLIKTDVGVELVAPLPPKQGDNTGNGSSFEFNATSGSSSPASSPPTPATSATPTAPASPTTSLPFLQAGSFIGGIFNSIKGIGIEFPDEAIAQTAAIANYTTSPSPPQATVPFTLFIDNILRASGTFDYVGLKVTYPNGIRKIKRLDYFDWNNPDNRYKWVSNNEFDGENLPAGTYQVQLVGHCDYQQSASFGFNYPTNCDTVDAVPFNVATLTITPAPASSVSCTPSPDTATVGDSITWTATGNNIPAGATYTWSGSDNLSGSGASVSKAYSSVGSKNAVVTVTNGGTSLATAACVPSVNVSNTACGARQPRYCTTSNGATGVQWYLDSPAHCAGAFTDETGMIQGCNANFCPAGIVSTEVKLRKPGDSSWLSNVTVQKGQSVEIQGLQNNAAANLEYAFNNSAAGHTGVIQSGTTTFTPTQSGTYTISGKTALTSGNACTGTGTITVTNAPTDPTCSAIDVLDVSPSSTITGVDGSPIYILPNSTHSRRINATVNRVNTDTRSLTYSATVTGPAGLAVVPSTSGVGWTINATQNATNTDNDYAVQLQVTPAGGTPVNCGSGSVTLRVPKQNTPDPIYCSNITMGGISADAEDVSSGGGPVFNVPNKSQNRTLNATVTRPTGDTRAVTYEFTTPTRVGSGTGGNIGLALNATGNAWVANISENTSNADAEFETTLSVKAGSDAPVTCGVVKIKIPKAATPDPISCTGISIAGTTTAFDEEIGGNVYVLPNRNTTRIVEYSLTRPNGDTRELTYGFTAPSARNGGTGLSFSSNEYGSILTIAENTSNNDYYFTTRAIVTAAGSPAVTCGRPITFKIPKAATPDPITCSAVTVTGLSASSEEFGTNGGPLYVLPNKTGNRPVTATVTKPTGDNRVIEYGNTTAVRNDGGTGGLAITPSTAGWGIAVQENTTTTDRDYVVTFKATAKNTDSSKDTAVNCGAVPVTFRVPKAQTPDPLACEGITTTLSQNTKKVVNKYGGITYNLPYNGETQVIPLTVPAVKDAANQNATFELTAVKEDGTDATGLIKQVSGRYLLEVPANNSKKTETIYVKAVAKASSTTLRQDPVECGQMIAVEVAQKSKLECKYEETTLKFKGENENTWKTNPGDIVRGQTVYLGGFHADPEDEDYDPNKPAKDTEVKVISPKGEETNKIKPEDGYKFEEKGDYRITVTTKDFKGEECTDSKTIKVTDAGFYTKGYRIAETLDELKTKRFDKYTEPLVINHSFTDKITIGPRVLYVQFVESNGFEERLAKIGTQDYYLKTINYVGPDPVVSGIACNLDIEGGGVVFDIDGVDLGAAKGTVKIGTADGRIDDWSEKYVKATFLGLIKDNKTDQNFDVTVTRPDGQKIGGKCAVGVTQLALGTKALCRDMGIAEGTQKVADLVIAEATESGGVVRERVYIGSDGYVKGLKSKLQEGRKYVIGVKAQGSLRSVGVVTASKGTTILSNFILPLGDLNADGRINAVDYRVLINSWRGGRVSSGSTTPTFSSSTASGSASFSSSITSSSSSQTGNIADLNDDSKVNTFDYACLRFDFNKVDAPEPQPGVIPEGFFDEDAKPSPSPTPRPTTSATPVVSAAPATSSATPATSSATTQ